MALLFISFIAGVLTVLAPCILPLLPVVLGGTATDTQNKKRPLIIVASLSVSVLVFTLLLKGSTALISVSPSFWTYISGVILAAFGLTLVFPELWARLILKIPGHNKPDAWISRGYGKKSSLWTDVIVGAALGPVFTTCSPTFFVIIATVLPQSFSKGIIDLLAYIIGLSLSLLCISWIGQKLINRLEWATNPYGWFKKTLGVLFIIVALAIVFGFDKKVETAILDAGFFDVTRLEQSIKQTIQGVSPTSNTVVPISSDQNATSSKPINPQTSLFQKPVMTASDIPKQPYIEFAGLAGFVNSQPFKLADLIGKKVVLIDFVDYSCINCQRTFPYVKDWYAKYKDQGLEIVFIHTPEFAFEKDKNNVQKAFDRFGITFPVVLDNDYATWNAYANQYWPHKYLIDIHGNIVYDHIGEGKYDETEAKIVEVLKERAKSLGEKNEVRVATSTIVETVIKTASPETYFGASRNQNFGNGRPSSLGVDSFELPKDLVPNYFYLGGTWKITPEYIEATKDGSDVSYAFKASNMYIVAESPTEGVITARVLIDGKPITVAQSGADVKDGVLMIHGSRLYHIFSDTNASAHRIDIIFEKAGVKAYTFTFG